MGRRLVSSAALPPSGPLVLCGELRHQFTIELKRALQRQALKACCLGCGELRATARAAPAYRVVPDRRCKLRSMTAIFNREHEPPEPGAADTAYEITKEVASLVPGAALVLDQVFGSPFSRRQQEWMEGTAAAIRRPENDRGIRPQELRDNPHFIDAAAAAYSAFVKTSDAGKRTALLNAVVNSALPSALRLSINRSSFRWLIG